MGADGGGCGSSAGRRERGGGEEDRGGSGGSGRVCARDRDKSWPSSRARGIGFGTTPTAGWSRAKQNKRRKIFSHHQKEKDSQNTSKATYWKDHILAGVTRHIHVRYSPRVAASHHGAPPSRPHGGRLDAWTHDREIHARGPLAGSDGATDTNNKQE